ncbi:MAG: alcohol dehydrogenase catalytic domain-containing protein [Anaerolineales bacterium]|nr:alcohol dehydrogenase catalytic domain-containing protein [Anaerolineales bacterium]
MRAIYVEKNIPRMLAVKALRGVWPDVVWSPISPANVVDMPDPPLPGARWLRVRNLQCGICASDMSLLYVKADPGVAPAALPGNQRFYLGHEVVGEVVEVGPQVARFSVGDRVAMESRFMGPNCHTQEIEPPCRYCAAGQTRLCENASAGLGPVGAGGGWGDSYTAHEAEVWPIPEDLDMDQASLVEPMAVALHGVLRRPPQADDRALVIGAGIIGLLTVQMIKVLQPEAHVAVMARYPHQQWMATRLGADELINESEAYERVAESTGGELYTAPLNRGMILGGFEVIYDCVGSERTVHDALRWTRAGGAVVLVGIDLGELTIDLNPIWYQEVDLIGSNTFGVENWKGRMIHTFDLVIEMLQEGVLEHEGLITHRFPLSEYKQAVDTARDKTSGAIKVMFMVDEG